MNVIKILEIHVKIMKIIKNHGLHERLLTIMQFNEFHKRITKIIKTKKENPEKLENHIILQQD